MIVGLKGGVAGSLQVIFEDKVDGSAEVTKLYLLLVDKAEVPRYIWVDGLDLHVCGCGEGGRLVPHEKSWEGAHLVEGKPMEMRQGILVIAEVCAPVVCSNDRSFHGLDWYSYRSWDLNDAVEA